jgi:hypothetical protein
MQRLPTDVQTYILREFFFPSFVLAELCAVRPVHDVYVVDARRLVCTFCETTGTLFALPPWTWCAHQNDLTDPGHLLAAYLDRLMVD